MEQNAFVSWIGYEQVRGKGKVLMFHHRIKNQQLYRHWVEKDTTQELCVVSGFEIYFNYVFLYGE